MFAVFYAFLFLIIFSLKTSDDICVLPQCKAPQTFNQCNLAACNQTVHHFYFSNKHQDGSSYFDVISNRDNLSKPYLEKLKTTVEKFENALLKPDESWINSIQKTILTQEQQAQNEYNNFLRYSNTYLVISELCSPSLIKNINKPSQEQFKKINNQLLQEITTLIKDRTRIINEKWKNINQKKPFFGFSLIKGHQDSLIIRTKNFLARHSRLFSQQNPEPRICYMILILKNIFKKINSLIYWNHIEKKIYSNNNTNPLATIISELTKFKDALEKYAEKIKSNITRNNSLDQNMQFEGLIEENIVYQFIKLINQNITVINNLIPKTQKPGAKNQPVQQICICPYLQTEIKINLNSIQDTLKNKANDYKTKIFNNIVELAIQIQTVYNNSRLLSDQLINQFLTLISLYYQIWSNELNNETHSGGSPIKTQYGNIQNSLTIIKNLKLNQFKISCNSISENIENRWTKQLHNENERFSSLKNWWKKRNYFFGFSLITTSRKNSGINRYTYMINQLENIFEIANNILDWYTNQSIITTIICLEKKKKCSPVSEITDPLQKIVAALQTYQNHFFQKQGLMNHYSLSESNIKEIPASLAINSNSYGLQVGIEYAIVNCVLDWIKGNIEIIKNISKEAKTEQKNSSSSSSSSSGDYYDADTIFEEHEFKGILDE